MIDRVKNRFPCRCRNDRFSYLPPSLSFADHVLRKWTLIWTFFFHICDTLIAIRSICCRKMLLSLIVLMILGVSSPVAAAGESAVGKEFSGGFDRVFCWGRLTDEDTARKLRAAGVTDIPVVNRQQYDLAVKYGITPYYGIFLPCGPHPQGLAATELEYQKHIAAVDCPGTAKERYQVASRRRIAVNYQYGGEPVSGGVEVLASSIACFRSDEGLELTRRRLDELMAPGWPEVRGIFLDFIGYVNYRSCECEKCRRDYRGYLRNNRFEDTPERKDAFFRDALIDYYNRVIGIIKSRRPDFKAVIHCYPSFMPEPLYGNRTAADICGQTVAWYFPWPPEKIASYTRRVLEDQHRYHRQVTGVPFLGVSAARGRSLYSKTPATVEKELQIILENGGRTLMVCNGNDMIKPGYFEVFRRYCGDLRNAPVSPTADDTEKQRGNAVLTLKYTKEKK